MEKNMTSHSCLNFNCRSLMSSYAQKFSQKNLSKFSLYYSELNLSYTYIAKNACTTLKKTLAKANGTLRETDSPHNTAQYTTHSYTPHFLSKK